MYCVHGNLIVLLSVGRDNIWCDFRCCIASKNVQEEGDPGRDRHSSSPS